MKKALSFGKLPRIQPLRAAAFLLLLAALVVTVYVRIRLLDFPLERDEGEYAYVGQLILDGIPPYGLAWTMKMPGTHLAYAAIMAVFGQSARGIHLGLLLVHLASLGLLYGIARKLFGFMGSIAAASAFGVMMLSPALLGLAAHASHFVVLAALAGLFLLLRLGGSGNWWKYAASGLCFGVAFLMKQPGGVFGIFAGLYLVYLQRCNGRLLSRESLMRIFGFASGCILPFLVVCAWLWGAGVFPQFWFCTVLYAHEYAVMTPLQEGVRAFLARGSNLIVAAPGLWILALMGCFCLLRKTLPPDRRVFLSGLLAFSFLGVSAGLYFRAHYFILMMPPVALLIGLAVQSLYNRLERRARRLQGVLLLLLALVLAQSLYAKRGVLFTLGPDAASRNVYYQNPFPESREIGRYLAARMGEDATVAILGSEPQICFYAHRRSATGHIYMYPLMEGHPFAATMQREMIQEVEQSRPEYFVCVGIWWSWLSTEKSGDELFQWFDHYAREHLEKVELIQILGGKGAVTYHGIEEISIAPPCHDFIEIYRRRPVIP
jgi:hypothetical protein